MSGCYLYCLLPHGHAPPSGLTGLCGAPVEGTDVGPFTAWISEVGERPEPCTERIREHHGVVQVALEDVTPLPVRFGEWAPDAATLAERLGREGERLRAALEGLQGTLEFGVRIAPEGGAEAYGDDPGAGDGADSGRDYMRELARRQAERRALAGRRRALATELREGLEGLIREEREGASTGGAGASVAHLVARDDAPDYVAAVERFRRARPDLAVDVIGPWPPYSFVP